MKVLLIFFYLLTIASCKTKQSYYHGIIVDQEQRPLSGVTITDSFQSTSSNKKGYFRLYTYEDFLPDLTFSKTGFQTRTIKTVSTMYGKVRYHFLNNTTRVDTLILKKITLPRTGYK